MRQTTSVILLDIPMAFETDRLIIRAPRPGDGLAVNAAIRETFEELKPWMPWAQTVPTVEETETVLRRHAADWITRQDMMMLLWRKSDGIFVGGSGLHRFDWSVPRMEIGYWLRTSMARQGYMTEAVKAITHFGMRELGAQRISIHCDARNTRSSSVAERAGYTLEARLHHFDRDVNGDLTDTLVYVTFPNR